jgi:hypothetical protein
LVPNAPASEHQLSARSSKLTTNAAPATLIVTPAIAIDPQLPQDSAKVTVTGRGFTAKSTVSIKYDDFAMTNSPATDDNGNFTYSFSLPQSSEKIHRYVATDQSGNTATLNTAADKASPPPPPSTPQPPSSPETPQKPGTINIKTLSKPIAVEPKGQRFGLFGTEPVNFIWSQVSAPGGITYTLEIADNYKFSPVNPGMRVSGLTQTNYTLKLDSGTYFWRVKAVDASGNESEWTNSLYAFNVGLLPSWAGFAAAGVIYLVIFYLVVRAFLHRRRRNPYYYY